MSVDNKKRSRSGRPKTATKSTAKKVVRSTKSGLDATNNVEESSTFTFRVEAYICKDAAAKKTEDPSVIIGESVDNAGEKSLKFYVDPDSPPPTFNMATAMTSFGVKSDELRDAADGDLTLTKLDVDKTESGSKKTFTLDIGVEFKPSPTFILNKFDKILDVKKVEVTFNKKKIETS